MGARRQFLEARLEAGVAEHLEVLDQRPALVRRQCPADHAIAATAGAEFMAAFKTLIEDPLAMLL